VNNKRRIKKETVITVMILHHKVGI